MTETTRITKEENRRLRWLYKAASKEKDSARPILTGLHVTDSSVVATDGFRLHAAESFYELSVRGLAGQTVTPTDLTARAETVTFEAVDTDQDFPDYSVVMPKGDPTFEVALSSRLLREALDGMKGDVNGRVLLRFYTPHSPIEVHGHAADGSRAYALIMPMSNNSKPIKPWRP